MLAVCLVCGITVLCMVLSVFFLPQIRIGRFQIGGYCFFAVLGALSLLLSGLLPLRDAAEGIFRDAAVNPVKILILFLSMTSFSVFLDEVGFFRRLASLALQRAGNSQFRLFFLLYVTVAVLTVFTSNDIIILTFTPFICAFAKRAGIRPHPYLFAEFSAANTWSMALMIGNPTNIYIAGFSGIAFFDYLRVMLVPTCAAGLVSFAVLFLLFRKSLGEPMHTDDNEVPPVSEKPLLIIGLVHLSLCILLVSLSGYIGLDMWLVSLCLAVSLFACVLVYRRLRRERPVILFRTLKRMPWEIVPFMLSMFILVTALEKRGVCTALTAALSFAPTVPVYGAASFFVANLMNNIPMSVLFADLSVANAPAAFASVVGSNLGACLTPVGALAGIMWSDILRRERVAFDLRDFVRVGAAVSLPALAAALTALSLAF